MTLQQRDLSDSSGPVSLLRPEPRPMGQAPGLDPKDLAALPSKSIEVQVTCIDYCPQQYHVEEVKDIPNFLARHRPSWSAVRWINVAGLENLDVIRRFAEKYELHPLAVEDVLRPGQRPKADDFPASAEHPGRLFVVAREVRLENERLETDQVCFFLGRTTLITFQGDPADVFDPVRQRIRTAESRIRNSDVSFLMYSLFDALVDHFFPILESYSERLEDLEQTVFESPSKSTLHDIHRVKRDLLLLRRAAWPMRELCSTLQRENHPCLSENTRTYLRDVYDHLVQIIDFIETYREFTAGLMETYMSALSNRMSDIVKTLTIISTIFVPLTFLVGVYGMNMPIPENDWVGSYPIFWGFALTLAGSMLFYFYRKGWIWSK